MTTTVPEGARAATRAACVVLAWASLAGGCVARRDPVTTPDAGRDAVNLPLDTSCAQPGAFHNATSTDAENLELLPGGRMRYLLDGCDMRTRTDGRWYCGGGTLVVLGNGSLPRNRLVPADGAAGYVEARNASVRWEPGAVCAVCDTGMGPSALRPCAFEFGPATAPDAGGHAVTPVLDTSCAQPGGFHNATNTDAENLELLSGGRMRYAYDGCDVRMQTAGRWYCDGGVVVVRGNSARLSKRLVRTDGAAGYREALEGTARWEPGTVCAICDSWTGPSGRRACEFEFKADAGHG
jgi:hypothetical protein